MRKILAVLIFLLVPTLSFAQSQTQGLTVMSACHSDQLNVGDGTNSNVVSAIGALLAPNWLNNHAGTTVVARFGDGNQAAFTVTAAGTLSPLGSDGCTPMDTSAWSWYNAVGSSDITDWSNGDVVQVDDGFFSGGPWGNGLNGNQH